MPNPDPASEGTQPSARSCGPDRDPGRVAIIMGSQSDWPVMRHAAETLEALGVAHDSLIVSAHRTPERLYSFARGAREAGYSVIIAGAGGAAHLPGMTAAMTALPVFGVPVPGHALGGRDALYSIVQMPGGVPVGTLAIGKPGAINAALLAAAVLALGDPALAERLDAYRAANTAAVAERPVDPAAGASDVHAARGPSEAPQVSSEAPQARSEPPRAKLAPRPEPQARQAKPEAAKGKTPPQPRARQSRLRAPRHAGNGFSG